MKKRKGLSMRYQITSDSTCDLSPEQLEQYNIRLLPLYVSMDGKTLRDGVDVKPDDIYAHVSAGGSLPQTAAVNLADYVRAFTELSKKNDFVIHVCISLDFSCCYQNAKLAAADFDNVYVVDSRNLSTGHGLVVLEAERMAREGRYRRGAARSDGPRGGQLHSRPAGLHEKGRPLLRRDASGRESVKAPPVHRGQRRQNGRRQKIPRQL